MANGKLTLAKFFSLSREEQNRRYQELSDEDKFGARQSDISSKESFVPCNYCKHYHGFAKCDAYPDTIPRDILDQVIADQKFQCSKEARFENMGHRWSEKPHLSKKK